MSVNTLINDATEIFIDNQEEILKGEFSKSLLETSIYKAQMEDILNISVDKVYNSEEVIEKELKGYQVINHLLNVFIKATVNNQNDQMTAFDKLALECIPQSYIHKSGSLYIQLLDISCFIASLTDGKALEWYEKVK